MKKSLNSDDQLFHQYQQNNHSLPQIIEHKITPYLKSLNIICKADVN
jgi:hypothetical protein